METVVDRSSRLEETAISSAALDPLAGWVLASSRSPPLALKVAQVKLTCLIHNKNNDSYYSLSQQIYAVVLES